MLVDNFETTVLSGPTDEVMTLLRDGYGSSYNEGRVQRILERAPRIVALMGCGALAGVALVEGCRIAAGATSANKQLGNRLGQQLLKACRQDGVAAWTSIGEQHRAARITASMGGMKRVEDPEVVTNLLTGVGRNNYDIEKNPEHGLVIVRESSLNPGYRQQIWAWLDHPALPKGGMPQQ